MSFHEKSAWAMLGIIIVVYGWYFAGIQGQVGAVEVGQIEYQGAMLRTVLTLVGLAIAAHILIAVVGEKGEDTADERDKVINRYGEYIGGYAMGVTALVALALSALEYPHFWIANVILAGLVVSEAVSLVTRIFLYRRGVVSW